MFAVGRPAPRAARLAWNRRQKHTIELKGNDSSLTIESLAPIARSSDEVELVVSDGAMQRVAEARALVDHHVNSGNVVYGLTTGFGKLKAVAISKGDLAQLQENLVLSHCCGVGEPMPIEEVRIAQVLRLNGLTRGHSGVRPELVQQLQRFFNKGFVPFVPIKGSVGASGDLAPLSHIAAAYMGWGKAYVRDGSGAWVLKSAAEALRDVGEEPVALTAKEGLALINGTEIMKATGVVAIERARKLVVTGDVVASISLEALMGTSTPFDARLAALKNDPGHIATSSNMRALLANSEVLQSHKHCGRVQDAYSLRCIPIVHGAVKNAVNHVFEVLSREINSVTDNPILFPEDKEILSAGHFHGQAISIAMDYLTTGLCTLANIAERRVEQLVNPDLSSLPGFLAPNPGLHSGYMIAQVAAAALCSENKVLAHPASVDTIPTSANQEDHVSMGTHASRKARTVLENVEHVVGIELLCAAQGREFKPIPGGAGSQAAYKSFREHVKPLEGDRFCYVDMEEAAKLVRDGTILAAAQSACSNVLTC